MWGDLHLLVTHGQSLLLPELGWCWILSRVTPALIRKQKFPSLPRISSAGWPCWSTASMSSQCQIICWWSWPKLSHLHFPKRDFGFPTHFYTCREGAASWPAWVIGSGVIAWLIWFFFFFGLKLPTGNEQRSLPLKHLGTLLIQGLLCTEQETQPANTEQLAIDLDY